MADKRIGFAIAKALEEGSDPVIRRRSVWAGVGIVFGEAVTIADIVANDAIISERIAEAG